jgi:large subunit ribosomal protein L15
MRLHEVHQGIQKYKKRKRVGRGPGSGHGKTSGRGHKGQGQLAGWTQLSIFQGGTMPLVRLVPKRGFNNKFALKVVSLNVRDLEEKFEAGEEVTPESLRSKSLAKRRYDVLKVLGDGELTKKLKVSAHRFSKSAKEKIEQAGGEAIVLPGPTPVEEKKKQKKEQKKQA